MRDSDGQRVRINSAMQVGNLAAVKGMRGVGNSATATMFNNVHAGVHLGELRRTATATRGMSGARRHGRGLTSCNVDGRAHGAVSTRGAGFRRSLSIENVHNSRTLGTIRCFVSSTVLMKVPEIEVLRNGNGKVLQRLVHRCLDDIPGIARCTSRRIRFNNTNVAMISF